MPHHDRDRWDARYAAQVKPTALQPPAWLLEHVGALAPGRALDLATGVGHTAIELARRGWQVDAIDISPVGLAHAATLAAGHGVVVNWQADDLNCASLPREHYDLITVFYYLDRESLPDQIVAALRTGGVLLYETFTRDQLRVPGNHVRNPSYLLAPGELLGLFPSLVVCEYREARMSDRAVASLMAKKGNR
jgi:SAM-dependent methyltransferase